MYEGSCKTGPGKVANMNQLDVLRADHESEVAEDYLEAIADIEVVRGECRGADLAHLFSVTHATVTQTVSRLRDAAFVAPEPYGPIRLTKSGRKVAQESRKRHETVYRFLLSIGVCEQVANVDAEGIEHHVSAETVSCMQKLIIDEFKERKIQ